MTRERSVQSGPGATLRPSAALPGALASLALLVLAGPSLGLASWALLAVAAELPRRRPRGLGDAAEVLLWGLLALAALLTGDRAATGPLVLAACLRSVTGGDPLRRLAGAAALALPALAGDAGWMLPPAAATLAASFLPATHLRTAAVATGLALVLALTGPPGPGEDAGWYPTRFMRYYGRFDWHDSLVLTPARPSARFYLPEMAGDSVGMMVSVRDADSMVLSHGGEDIVLEEGTTTVRMLLGDEPVEMTLDAVWRPFRSPMATVGRIWRI